MSFHRFLLSISMLSTILGYQPNPLQLSINPLIYSKVNAELTCEFTYINTIFDGNQVSADGRYIVFQKLTPYPGRMDAVQVYVYDKLNRTTEQVSLSWDGKSYFNGEEYSAHPTISGDGTYVVFFSQAAELVQEPDVQGYQLYLRDRVKATTKVVSVGVNGAGNGDPKDPYLSPDGRYIVFDSLADNLVPVDSNGSVDAFIRDLKLGVTEMVSVASDGSQGTDGSDHGHLSSSVSSDGRFVVFYYGSLEDDEGVVRSGLFLRDRLLKETNWIGPGNSPSITPDGKYISFVSSFAYVPQDLNEATDTYLFNRTSGAYELISLTSAGKISASGASMSRPAISSDGNKIVFISSASDLVPGDNNGVEDVFLRDRLKRTTTRLTVGHEGLEANGPSYEASLSENGNTITIISSADNLDPRAFPPNYGTYLYLCEVTPAFEQKGIKLLLPFLSR